MVELAGKTPKEIGPGAVPKSIHKQIDPKEYKNLTDNDGEPFDKRKHRTTKDGRPVLTKLGNLMADSTSSSEKPKDQGETSDDRIEQAAREEAELIDQMGGMIGGEKWALQNQEKKRLVQQLERCHEAYGFVQPPPWAGLVVFAVGYTGSRVNKEQIKDPAAWKKAGAWLYGNLWLSWWDPKKKKALWAQMGWLDEQNNGDDDARSQE